MPRDYVNDFGRPDPKNRSRRRGGRPQGSGGKSNAITFLAIIVLILLCAVFFDPDGITVGQYHRAIVVSLPRHPPFSLAPSGASVDNL